MKLPGDIGFGEVVIELAVAEQRKDPKSQVVVYFLGPDLTTPLKLQPTNVSVHLLFPDAGPQTFTLSTQPRSDDPAGAGRFASQPAPLPIDEPLGELIAVFGAETFRAPISSVR